MLPPDDRFDEEATERERASIISGREDEMYQAKVDEYKEAADWTIDDKVWGAVNFDTIYSKAQVQGDSAGETDETAADSDEADTAAEETVDTNAANE